MRIGVSGKGGVGKTTIAAGLARTFARRGDRVLAIDCDSDPNLATSIGIPEAEALALQPLLDQSGPQRSRPVGQRPQQILEAYGYPAPDGVTFVLAARIEKAGSGCTGEAHISVRGLIEQIEQDMPAMTVVADMEAGLEHLSWAGGTLRYVDLLLVVLEPTAKVLITADRTHRLAVELGIPDVAFVGSRANEPDRARLAAFAAERDRPLLAMVPDDVAVRDTDRAGRSLLDAAPNSPSAHAIEQLADALHARLSVAAAGPAGT